MSEGAFFCPHDGCGKTYKRQLSLNCHLNWHADVRNYQCDLCDKSYTRSSFLKRHIATKHCANNVGNSSEFKCERENCGKEFKSSQALKKHLAAHDKRIYKCHCCNKAFFKNKQLKIHEYEHTGVLPFKCPHEGCTKAFIRPSRLKAHLKCHMEYKCNEAGCNETFTKWTLLRSHKVIKHKPVYRCNFCEKSFTTKNSQKSHSAIHKETRDVFLCPHDNCPRYYYFENNLNAHVKSHHEGKVHVCTFQGCEKKFLNKRNWKEHIKIHEHGPKPKKKTRPRKRRSMASRITGHKGSLLEELVILKKANEPAIVTKTAVSDVEELPLQCTEELPLHCTSVKILPAALPASCSSESLICTGNKQKMKEITQEVA